MDINTINLILWAPFGVVALLATLVYGIKGLRKGPVPALVSLGALLLSTLISVFAARMLATMAAPALLEIVPADTLAEGAAFSGMIEMLLYSLVATLLALVIFMGLFFVLTPVVGALCKLILRKKWEPKPLTGGHRAGGAAIGLATALVYALVLLLPLYGSLAAYAPVVRSALDMLPADAITMEAPQPQVRQLSTAVQPLADTEPQPYSEMQMLREILDAILQHPLVEISSSAPVQSVYQSLSQVSTQEAPVNFAEMADSMQVFAEKVAAVTQAPEGEEQLAAVRELVAYLQSDVLQQEWAYGVYAAAIEELPAMMADGADPMMESMLAEATDVLAFTREEFVENMSVMLDFAQVVLEQPVLDALEQEDLEAILDSGVLQELVATVNATPKMAELKNLGYRIFMEAAGEEAGEQTRAFAEKYPLPQLTDPEQQAQELDAFMVLLGLDNSREPADFFLMHPALGETAYKELEAIING